MKRIIFTFLLHTYFAINGMDLSVDVSQDGLCKEILRAQRLMQYDTYNLNLASSQVDETNVEWLLPIFKEKTSLVRLSMSNTKDSEQKLPVDRYLFSKGSLEVFKRSLSILQARINAYAQQGYKLRENEMIMRMKIYAAVFDTSYVFDPRVLPILDIDAEIEKHALNVAFSNKTPAENKSIIKKYYCQYLLLNKDEINQNYRIDSYLLDKYALFFGDMMVNNRRQTKKFDYILEFEKACIKESKLLDDLVQAVPIKEIDKYVFNRRHTISNKRITFQRDAHDQSSCMQFAPIDENQVVSRLCRKIFLSYTTRYNDLFQLHHESSKDMYILNSIKTLREDLFKIFVSHFEKLTLESIKTYYELMVIFNPFLCDMLDFKVSLLNKDYSCNILYTLLEILDARVRDAWKPLVSGELVTLEYSKESIEDEIAGLVRIAFQGTVKEFLQKELIQPVESDIEDMSNVILNEIFSKDREYEVFSDLEFSMKEIASRLYGEKFKDFLKAKSGRIDDGIFADLNEDEIRFNRDVFISSDSNPVNVGDFLSIAGLTDDEIALNLQYDDSTTVNVQPNQQVQALVNTEDGWQPYSEFLFEANNGGNHVSHTIDNKEWPAYNPDLYEQTTFTNLDIERTSSPKLPVMPPLPLVFTDQLEALAQDNGEIILDEEKNNNRVNTTNQPVKRAPGDEWLDDLKLFDDVRPQVVEKVQQVQIKSETGERQVGNSIQPGEHDQRFKNKEVIPLGKPKNDNANFDIPEVSGGIQNQGKVPVGAVPVLPNVPDEQNQSWWNLSRCKRFLNQRINIVLHWSLPKKIGVGSFGIASLYASYRLISNLLGMCKRKI